MLAVATSAASAIATAITNGGECYRRRPTSPGVPLRGRKVHAKLAVVEQGIVAFWRAEDGWGAVEVPGRDGVGFVHYADVAGRTTGIWFRVSGYMSSGLTTGAKTDASGGRRWCVPSTAPSGTAQSCISLAVNCVAGWY
jgi:hypothetical protein